MVIASIKNTPLAYCDVAPIHGSTNYVTVTRAYPPSYAQRTDNIYRSGFMFENYTGYTQVAFFYMFDTYPTNFASAIGGSVTIYNGGNGYYVGYFESGANFGTFTDADISFNGEIYHGWWYPTFLSMISEPYQTYTWSSVPAISGKNGILSLSTLKSGSINNGNPVSDATLNAFEILIEASNVGKLVLDTDIDESQVVIRYNIPNNTYQYVKLVYKENYAPESISDGVAIDIQQTDTQLVLDDITTTGTYYFKIFTDNGNSNTVVLNYVGIIPIIIKIERVW